MSYLHEAALGHVTDPSPERELMPPAPLEDRYWANQWLIGELEDLISYYSISQLYTEKRREEEGEEGS